MNVLDTLAKASPNQRTVTMCVDGALQARWDALNADLDAAAEKDSAADTGSLAMPNLTRIVNDMETIRDQVKASEVTFTFQKMPWTERLQLQADHPPRPGQVIDQLRGFNVLTFYPRLIAKSCVSVTGVDGDTATDIPQTVWDGLLGTPAEPVDPAADGLPVVPATAGSLNLGQIDRLIAAAEQVNNGATQVPPSARSLLASQDSGTSLAQPGPGTSAPDGSKGGSRPGSPTSSTTPTTTTTEPSQGSPAGT